jgi:hypothetical protein
MYPDCMAYISSMKSCLEGHTYSALESCAERRDAVTSSNNMMGALGEMHGTEKNDVFLCKNTE